MKAPASRSLASPPPSPPRPPRALGLAGVTGLGVAVRFASLGLQSYQHDEVITAMRVLHGSFGHMLHEVKASESNPPLYYVLAWGWTGPSAWAKSNCASCRRCSGCSRSASATCSGGSWPRAASALPWRR